MEYQVIRNDKINEEIYLREMENGLKIFFMPKKDYVRKYAIFTTKYGSNDNRFIPIGEEKEIVVPEGIAHFLEHKLFEEPEGNIFNEFSNLGSYVNAYTNFNQTAYLFSATDRFYENLELLVKFVQNPYFTDESVNKEKGIIEQEIRMYDDSADWKVFFNCLRGMYHCHPVRVDIAGTVESINKIDKETLYKCYNTFYSPQNMILFMVGDINYEKAIDTISKKLKKRENSIGKEIRRQYPDEPKSINEKLMEESLKISTPLFNIGFKDTDIGYEGQKLLEKEIATNIILEMIFGDSTELYQKLYDEGLINSSFRSQYIGYKDYGHSILGGESEKPKLVIEKILDHIEKVKKSGINMNDFARIKKKLVGYHLMDFNSIEFIANSFTTYYFSNTSLMKYLDILEGIGFEEVSERMKQHFTSDNYSLSIINPS